MTLTNDLDAVVVGSGPNGLAAAVTFARAGLSVKVYEGADAPGGGCRTEASTIDGFAHDTCSAVHPLLVASPFFREFYSEGAPKPELLFPPVAVAHPLGGTEAAAIEGTVTETAAHLGVDERAWNRLLGPFVANAEFLIDLALAPPLRSWPGRPLTAARFGALGTVPASFLVRSRFREPSAKALFSGIAAHSMRPLGAPLTSAFGLLLTTLAHHVGWPVIRGGSQHITDSLIVDLEAHGGEVITGRCVRSLSGLPRARIVLLDLAARDVLHMSDAWRRRYRWELGRFRYGPGVFKMDLALSGPVPWSADACRRAATVHVGGRFEEVAQCEADVAAGRHPERPFCLVVQPGVVDPTRAPEGQQTLWAYCHVPAGSEVDMTSRIEAQIERFAPGFRDLIKARSVSDAVATEKHNPNYVGGDIGSGAATLRQTLFRPTIRWNNYRTPIEGVYLCGASTPPGAGVHGMCGYLAAKTALADIGLRRQN